jgi:glycosyltransferase involved in cell wall biosynthesis
MKVLFVTQYFPPEIEPSAAKVHDLACKLAEYGHSVTVITGFPNYPSGVIPVKYRGKLYLSELKDGVKVLRTFLIPSPNRGIVRRILNQLSFLISATLRGLLVKRPDVIVTSSPPLETGLAGYLLSWIKRLPFVFEVRDAWPKAVVIVGVLRHNFLITLAEAIEKFLYQRASKVVVVTRGVEAHVIERGATKDKVVLIPNGTDTELFRPDNQGGSLRVELGLAEKFIAIYAGTHGLQANLTSVLQAARLLQNLKEIVFLFVGDGAEKPALLRLSQESGLPNVIFLNPQTRERLAQFLSIADVGIVHTRKDPFFEGYLPVKMFEYMAAGCPIVLGANGESRALVEEAKAGIWVGPENPQAMAEGILRLYENPHLLQRMGKNGRKYAIENFSRTILVQRYQEVLANVLNPTKGAKHERLL